MMLRFSKGARRMDRKDEGRDNKSRLLEGWCRTCPRLTRWFGRVQKMDETFISTKGAEDGVTGQARVYGGGKRRRGGDWCDENLEVRARWRRFVLRVYTMSANTAASLTLVPKCLPWRSWQGYSVT